MNSLILSIVGSAAIALTSSGCTADMSARVVRSGSSSSRQVVASRKIVKKTYKPARFTAIGVAQGIKVHYTPRSGAPSATVEGPDNIVPLVNVHVVDGTLQIRYVENVSISYSGDQQPVQVYLTAPAVDEFGASSGAAISVAGSLTLPDELEVSVSSGATVSFASVKAGEAELKASSGASVLVTTLKVGSAEISCSSGANISVPALTARSVEANASSGADILLSGKTDYAALRASSSAKISASALSASRGTARASSSGTIVSSIRQADVQCSSGGTVRNR